MGNQKVVLSIGTRNPDLYFINTGHRLLTNPTDHYAEEDRFVKSTYLMLLMDNAMVTKNTIMTKDLKKSMSVIFHMIYHPVY